MKDYNIKDESETLIKTINNIKLIKEKTKNKKKYKNHFLILLFFILILICIFIFPIYIFINKIIKKKKNIILFDKDYLINEPFLPPEEYNKPAFEYNKSYYNSSHIRYNFKDLFLKRKKYKINYSYIPYQRINKSISYEENANYIYNLTGMLNITKLNYYYNNNKINSSEFNHIHLAMGFDINYTYLSTISIASILNTSSFHTFIHLHIVVSPNYTYTYMSKLINLKKIYKNIEFIFYSGKQADYDFEWKAKGDERTIGNYYKMLASQIVNNTNKILLIDSGDTLVQKDLSEIFYFDLEDNYFGWILEDMAGNNDTMNLFFRNKFYPNSGVCLINVRLFRKDNLYERIFYSTIAYKRLPCPFQDIFLIISNYRFKYFPLKYNLKQFFNNEKKLNISIINSVYFKRWIKRQNDSLFKYSKDEILEAVNDPVVIHLYQEKVERGMCNEQYTNQWVKYANMTGYYLELKKKYPKPFLLYKRFNEKFSHFKHIKKEKKINYFK